MRVPEGFRRSFDNIYPKIQEVMKRAECQLEDIANAYNGHYTGRSKSVNSVLSKAETAKFKKIIDMEDLFAAVIAVPSKSQIHLIKEAVNARFNIVDTKEHWKKNPREFIYDDLHLLLTLKDDPVIRDKSILDIKFELQIKTYLQLAWWELEHNEVYKTNRLSWQKARIFGQIKAMFELADRMLANIDQVANIQEEEQYEEYMEINKTVEVLECYWDEKEWYDLRRASETVIKFLKTINQPLEQLRVILDNPQNDDIKKARSITPVQAVLIALFREYKTVFLENISNTGLSLCLTEEMLDFEPQLQEIPANYRMIL